MIEARRISKLLSYWLRHAPEAAGLLLDGAGWADVGAVLAALGRDDAGISPADLQRVVADSDKNRFELSADGALIRARQGHSVAVEADWQAADPPELLYHGTVERFLDAILANGLVPQARHHVHLSADIATARLVGERRGRPVVLQVSAGELAANGHPFFISSNGVWLVDHVPPNYLTRM